MSYRDDFNRDFSDAKWTFGKVFWPFIGAVAVLLIVFGVIGRACSAAGEAGNVAQKEFGAAALLKKYEWFKDAASQLDKKSADIRVYENKAKSIAEAYGTTPRQKWARDDREQLALWDTEVAGIKASYNSLVAEYNAQMAKANWRFANVGKVPAGAEVLPREFRQYETK